MQKVLVSSSGAQKDQDSSWIENWETTIAEIKRVPRKSRIIIIKVDRGYKLIGVKWNTIEKSSCLLKITCKSFEFWKKNK